MITVLTPARSHDLVDLATVEARLGTEASEQALLQGLIAEASSWIEDQLWPLVRQRYLQKLAGHGRTRLVLARRPVEPGTLSIEVDGEAVTDWELESDETGIVYRACGWPCGSELDVAATHYGGYIPPTLLQTWSATLAVSAGEWIRPTKADASAFRFEATVGGSTSATEPTWADAAAAGDTLVDGTVTWTARAARELPSAAGGAAWLLVKALYDHALSIGNVARLELVDLAESAGGAAAGGGGVVVPSAVERFLRSWRS